MSWLYQTPKINIEGYGESLFDAGETINTFFSRLSTDWYGFVAQYTDAKASQVISVPFSKLETTVYEFLSSTYNDGDLNTNGAPRLIIDKMTQLPASGQEIVYNTNYTPETWPQQHGFGDAPRAVTFDGTIGLWRFANNNMMTSTYSDFIAMIGNVYMKEERVELITNGVVYNYGQDWTPGTTYYLTDLMDGWLVPYQEGGEGVSVSIPMLVAVHKNAGIMLSHRGITKDLPCAPTCPPVYLGWQQESRLFTTIKEPPCENVQLHVFSNGSTEQSNIIDFSNYSRILTYDNEQVVNDQNNPKHSVSSIKFNGDLSSMIRVNNTESMGLGNNQFTIEFDIKFSDQARNDYIIGAWASNDNNTGWFITSPVNTAGVTSGLKFVSKNNGKTLIEVGVGYAFTNNTWYHVALSRHGNTAEDWVWNINGKQQQNHKISGTYNCSISNAKNGQLRIGSPGVDVEYSNVQSLSTLGDITGGYSDFVIDDFYKMQMSATATNQYGQLLPAKYEVMFKNTLDVVTQLKIRFTDMTGKVLANNNSVGDNVKIYLINGDTNSLVVDYTRLSTEPTTLTKIYNITPIVDVTGILIECVNKASIEYLQLVGPSGDLPAFVIDTMREPDQVPLLGNLNDVRITVGTAVYKNNFLPRSSRIPSCYDGCELMLTIPKPAGYCEYTPDVSDVIAIYSSCGVTGGNQYLPTSEPQEDRFPPVVTMKQAEQRDTVIGSGAVSNVWTSWDRYETWVKTLSTNTHDCFSNALVLNAINSEPITYRFKNCTAVFALRHTSWTLDESDIQTNWYNLGSYDLDPNYKLYYMFFRPGDHVISNRSAYLMFKPLKLCDNPTVDNTCDDENRLIFKRQYTGSVSNTNPLNGNEILRLDFSKGNCYDPDQSTNTINGAYCYRTVNDLTNTQPVKVLPPHKYYDSNGGYIQFMNSTTHGVFDYDLTGLPADTTTVTVELWARKSSASNFWFGWGLYNYIDWSQTAVTHGFGDGGTYKPMQNNRSTDASRFYAWTHLVLEFNTGVNNTNNKIWFNGEQRLTTSAQNNTGNCNFNNFKCRLFGWRYNDTLLGNAFTNFQPDGELAMMTIWNGPCDDNFIKSRFAAHRDRFGL